jgi:phosphoribosylformylglycinamidine cyclo-ligase
MAINYKSSGVDVEAGDNLVDWLKESSPKVLPHADKLVSGIGGFAAIFRLKFPEMKKPCLVSATDGVGTKIKLAAHFQKYAGVGQDLVAMCVNDLVCCGAAPLFFLDYYASAKLDLGAAKEFLGGVRGACIEADCALIGGETAEMPGVYHGRDFDAAGFAVGIVDEDEILGSNRVSIGDEVWGVSSSGFHSNGYSLLRRVFEGDLETWCDTLMVPTHLYVKLARALTSEKLVNAMANITGGGMENIPRVMPNGTTLPLLDWSWPQPFCEVQDRTDMSREEMLKTLNCGIGFVVVAPLKNSERVKMQIESHGFIAYSLGRIQASENPQAEPYVKY